MDSCTILIPHVNTPYYLPACVGMIHQQAHPDIRYEILIMDQSTRLIQLDVIAMFAADPLVRIVALPRADAGYPIDVGASLARYDYLCTLDCDAFPISNQWLRAPIRLLEEFNLSFVGSHTGLEDSYKHQGHFFHVNNYYRVSRTAVARELSEAVGFMRTQTREKVAFTPRDTSWGNEPCDNGVVAQWYSDRGGYGGKASLAIDKILGVTPKMGVYGMVIEDLVFHLVFGFAEDWLPDPADTLGSAYADIREQVLREGMTAELVADLVRQTTADNRFPRRSYRTTDEAKLWARLDALKRGEP